MALKLRRLSNALGAEVCDIDLTRPMSESTFGEIYSAFLKHGILLFRNQNITREQHIEFSAAARPPPRLPGTAPGHQQAQ